MNLDKSLDGSVPTKTSNSTLPQILALNNITGKTLLGQGGKH
jgi:hypothetical protein